MVGKKKTDPGCMLCRRDWSSPNRLTIGPRANTRAGYETLQRRSPSGSTCFACAYHVEKLIDNNEGRAEHKIAIQADIDGTGPFKSHLKGVVDWEDSYNKGIHKSRAGPSRGDIVVQRDSSAHRSTTLYGGVIWPREVFDRERPTLNGVPAEWDDTKIRSATIPGVGKVTGTVLSAAKYPPVEGCVGLDTVVNEGASTNIVIAATDAAGTAAAHADARAAYRQVTSTQTKAM